MGTKVTAKIYNVDLLKKQLSEIEKTKLQQALGQAAALVEADAKDTLISNGMGELARSIQYTVNDNYAEVFTTVPYATYVEFGTGKFAENGDGRPGWWVWVDPECGAPKSTHRIIYDEISAKQCQASLAKLYGIEHVHITQGQPPLRFLRGALENNEEEIAKILKGSITGA